MNLSRLLSWIVPARSMKEGRWRGPAADSAWLRWIASLAVVGMATNVFLFSSLSLWAAAANALAGLLVAAYFARLFFYRLADDRFSRVAVGGTTLGMCAAFLSIPGVSSNAIFLSLSPWLWVVFLYSATLGAVQARLLGHRSQGIFLAFWAANVAGILAPALFLLGFCLLIISQVKQKVLGLSDEALFFLVPGVLGLGLRVILSIAVGAVARKILLPDRPTDPIMINEP
ncbi:MAG: hypothetical protein HY291_13785 [Planctomycetes bacterium]|nr:hypothetical protein [Planctomycetota bacterium]